MDDTEENNVEYLEGVTVGCFPFAFVSFGFLYRISIFTRLGLVSSPELTRIGDFITGNIWILRIKGDFIGVLVIKRCLSAVKNFRQNAFTAKL